MDFMEGCEKLHRFFGKFLEVRPEFAEGSGVDFATIAGQVQNVLEEQAPKEGRITAWQRAAQSGDLYAGGGEEIPAYEGSNWINRRGNMGGEDSPGMLVEPVYRFYQAAQAHRSHILRDLLPKHGLVVA